MHFKRLNLKITIETAQVNFSTLTEDWPLTKLLMSDKPAKEILNKINET